MTLNVDMIPLYVGGSDHVGEATPIHRENPARTSDRVGSVCAANPSQVGAAVEAAQAASRAWSDLGIDGRVRALAEAWTFGDDERAALSTILTMELGKVLADTRGELDYGIAYVDFAMTNAAATLANQVVNDAAGRFLFRSVPYGVVAAIIPWNAPLNISSTVVGPALVAGNTVVVKPSPLAPLAVTTYLRAIARHLPAGVLNVVNGDADVGEALVSDPRVGKIAFTGSTGVGRQILRSAAAGVTPSLLELGGNDAAVVLDDVELSDELVARLVFGSFLTAGQVCMAIKRLFVHESIFTDVVERYREVARRVLQIGDPMDPRVTIGPLVSKRQVEMVSKFVESAAAEGASVIELGTKVDDGFDLAGGYYLRPSLVLNATRDSQIVVEEQFGPTVPILPFSDVDDAVEAANNSDYGLCASVWTADEERAFEIGCRLEAGTVFVNTHNRSGMALQAPFGGMKLSGYGREYGTAGVLEFAQSQTISRVERSRAGADIEAGRRYAV